MLLLTTENTLCVAELTVGHESNLENNSIRKKQKYSKLVKELKDHYKSVIFINISMSCLGVFANESRSLLTMFDKIGFDKKQQDFCVKRMTTIAIRTTYFIFNKQTKQENLRITLNLYLYVPLTHQLRCKYIAAALVTLHGGLKAKDTLTQQNEELLSRPM